jgi:hypothetical protein
MGFALPFLARPALNAAPVLTVALSRGRTSIFEPRTQGRVDTVSQHSLRKAGAQCMVVCWPNMIRNVSVSASACTNAASQMPQGTIKALSRAELATLRSMGLGSQPPRLVSTCVEFFLVWQHTAALCACNV